MTTHLRLYKIGHWTVELWVDGKMVESNVGDFGRACERGLMMWLRMQEGHEADDCYCSRGDGKCCFHSEPGR